MSAHSARRVRLLREAVLDDAGQVEALLASGLTSDEFQGLGEMPGSVGSASALSRSPIAHRKC